MAHSLDNLEKLIQLATIEHMYSMLHKLKLDASNNIKDKDVFCLNKENKCFDEKYLTQNNDLINNLFTEIKNLNSEIIDHTEKLRRNNSEIWQLTQSLSFFKERTEKLEAELSEIKNNTNNNSRYLCNQIRGQQKLTSYPGFMTGVILEEAHIKLKIEEKGEVIDRDDVNPNIITCSSVVPSEIKAIKIKEEPNVEKVKVLEVLEIDNDESVEDEVEDEEEDEEEVEVEEESEDDVEEVEEPNVEEVEEVEEPNVEKVKVLEVDNDELVEEVEVESEEDVEEVEEEVEEVEEEVEEEVGTEDEKDNLEKVEETLEEEEEEEEEEEVFEIDIDDVTYFATSEENGILYEITDDGEVGKKVGIIKDGEPIFS